MGPVPLNPEEPCNHWSPGAPGSRSPSLLGNVACILVDQSGCGDAVTLAQLTDLLPPTAMVGIASAIISIVSASISYRQATLARRSRLSQVIDEINKADYAFNKQMADDSDVVAESVVASYNDRLLFLASDALRLIPKSLKKVPSIELLILANVFDHVGDIGRGRRLYEASVVAAKLESRVNLSTAYERFGAFLFDADQPDEGVVKLRKAIDILNGEPGNRAKTQLFYAIGMLLTRLDRFDHQKVEIAPLLDRARTVAESATNRENREQMISDLDAWTAEVKAVDAPRTPSQPRRRRPNRL
jgi:hypothetical protein